MIPVLPLPVKNFYHCGFFRRSVFRGIKVYWDRASAKLARRPVYLCVEQGDGPDDVGSLTTFAKRKKGYAARRSHSAHTTFVKIIRMDRPGVYAAPCSR